MVDCVFADVAQPDQVKPQMKVYAIFKRLLMLLCKMDSYEPASMMKCSTFQGRIVALNSQFFLKNGGNFVISIKVSDTN